jgi:hypothetical protein
MDVVASLTSRGMLLDWTAGVTEFFSNICAYCDIHVLTTANMNMTAFWDTAPCSFVEVDRCFRGAYCLRHQGDVGGSLKR